MTEPHLEDTPLQIEAGELITQRATITRIAVLGVGLFRTTNGTNWESLP